MSVLNKWFGDEGRKLGDRVVECVERERLSVDDVEFLSELVAAAWVDYLTWLQKQRSSFQNLGLGEQLIFCLMPEMWEMAGEEDREGVARKLSERLKRFVLGQGEDGDWYLKGLVVKVADLAFLITGMVGPEQ